MNLTALLMPNRVTEPRERQTYTSEKVRCRKHNLVNAILFSLTVYNKVHTLNELILSLG